MRRIICCCLVFILCYPVPVRASDYDGAGVTFRVEGPTGTLAAGTVNGFTFKDALETLAAKSGLSLTFAHTGTDSRLFGVSHMATDGAQTFEETENAKWLGYVVRDGEMVWQASFLAISLQPGDEVVAYYGDPAQTLVLTEFTCTPSGDGLTFYGGTILTEWKAVDGVWTETTVRQPAVGITVHVRMPDGKTFILTTNEAGEAHVAVTQIGAVRYYAEGYRANDVPLIVRTATQTVLYGMAFDGAYVSRAEAVHFLMAALAPGNGETIDEPVFADVDAQTAYYDAITAAFDRGVVVGYGDGMFRPDRSINLMELCAIAAKLLPILEEATAGGATEETDEPATGGETSEPAAGSETDEPATRNETDEPAAEGETDEPAAGSETDEPAAGSETGEPAAGSETGEPAAGTDEAGTEGEPDETIAGDETNETSTKPDETAAENEIAIGEAGLLAWAAAYATEAYSAGLLDGIDLAWQNPVTPAVFKRFFLNMMNAVA